MNRIKIHWIGIFFVLFLSTLACSMLSGSNETTVAPTAQSNQESTAAPILTPEATLTSEVRLQSSGYESEFPLPDDVRNFKELQEGQINYETSMSLAEISDFYREEFTSQGLRERTLLTVINDNALSMVFEGSANGKLVVVQAVFLTDEGRNVNVRYE